MPVSTELLEALSLIHLRLNRLEAAGAREGTGAVLLIPHRAAESNAWEANKLEIERVNQQFLAGMVSKKKRHQYTYEQIKEMIRKYNAYWLSKTGIDIGFTFGEANVGFMTMAEPALRRNEYLRALFPYAPVVVEPFAGCGADTISFMYNLGASKIYASDYANKFEVDYIRRNVENFKRAVPGMADVDITLFKDKAEDFFGNLRDAPDAHGNTVVPHVDLLYLDPPWRLDGMSQNQEATPGELLNYLAGEVFRPLFDEGFLPHIIVVKTRFGWEEMREMMSNVKGYRHVFTMKFTPLRREVNFHVLQSDMYEVVKLLPSDDYEHIYRGKPLPALPQDETRRIKDYGRFEYARRRRQDEGEGPLPSIAPPP